MTTQSVAATVSDGTVYETVTISFGTPSVIMGEPAQLPTPDGNNANYLVVQQAALAQDATLQSLSINLSVALGKIRLGVYDINGNKVAETGEITAVVGWNTAPIITPVQLKAGSYWLSYFASANVSTQRVNTGSGKWWFLTYGSMPSKFPTSAVTNATMHWSLYATLSIAGVPGPVYAGPFNVVSAPQPSFKFDIVRSKTSHVNGSWYFEMLIKAAIDVTKVGVGLDNNVESLTTGGGQIGGICWFGDGSVNYNGAVRAYTASPFSVGDILGVDVNLTTKTIRFRVNGGSFSDVFSISAIVSGSMFALAQLAASLDQVKGNFTGPFVFVSPSTAWG